MTLATSVVVSGCGSGQQQPNPTAAHPGQPTTTAPATTPRPGASTAAPARPRCATSALTITLGRSGAAAGTSYTPIVFRNRSSRTCTLTGYPGVSFTDAAGQPVGYPARRNPSSPVAPVTLGPGATATSALGVPAYVNYPANRCQARAATKVRVYPPNQRDSVLVSAPATETVCTTKQASPSVTPVQPGR